MKEHGSDKLDIFFLNWRLIFTGLICLAALLVMVIIPLSKMILSLRWQEIPCKILNSELKLVNEKTIAANRIYKIQIQFKYSLNGKSYICNKYNFDDGHDSFFPERKGIVVSRFPIGLETTCYVNQKNPSDAVLYRGPYARFWFGLVPLIGLIVVLRLLYNIKKKRKELLSKPKRLA